MVFKVCLDLFISLVISNALRALILTKNHIGQNNLKNRIFQLRTQFNEIFQIVPILILFEEKYF